MTVDWFEPIPIESFAKLNHANESVPDQLPVPEPVGGADIRCGPILRLVGTLENNENFYRASIMIVVKADESSEDPKVSYIAGPASGSGEPQTIQGSFPGLKYFEVKGYQFWRFNINMEMMAFEQKVKYAINGVFKPEYLFFVPGAGESMNVISFSCNGFSLGTDTLGYPSSLWLDVLQKHVNQHYHVMLGGGDQIYCDAVKLHSKKLEEWMSELTSHKRSMKASPELIQEFEDYYLDAYLGWFGQGFWVGKAGKTLQPLFPLSMAQIPSVNIYDDHDIIDGFGSYEDPTMASSVFSTIGNVAYKYYMLFQHQMSLEEPAYLEDPNWILSKKEGPFIKQKSHSTFMRLGREISLLGLDCRTERKLTEVVSASTYKIVFERLEAEITKAPETKHLLVMLGVPILYPRLVWLEKLLNSPFLKPIRTMAQKGIIARGLVNEFDGGVEVLDDLNDHWCSKNHKRERNFLLLKLIEFGAKHGVRITILSGDVHLCCIGRLKSKFHHHVHSHALKESPEQLKEHNLDVLQHPESDPRLIFNVISSAIMNAPPPDAMALLLNRRSKIHHFSKNTDEDVLPFFRHNPNGTARDNHQFLNQRNWSDLILAKQSIHKEDIGKNIMKFPQCTSGKDASHYEKQELDARHIKYPLLESSLVTTLRVEKDPTDLSADTEGYEVLIPHLEGTHKLEKVSIKHLD